MQDKIFDNLIGNFKGLSPSTTPLWKEKVLLGLLN